ncbi:MULTISPECIES: OmpG porin family protein [unclassified Methylophaga]|jgi:putative OmpG-porin 1 family protein|uniref:OmpG porin family protein n=1 Tax=unclassified Methylophaga TaxID=2629249 RepID=UPI000C37A99E|nr:MULTISPECIES: OmpG porin family protein [unclassified Methylophaga]MAL48897.1 hypothetical protein [Methylophaga sp.]MBP25466.1 hypothetical protein [Methylophaga sp.]|tara:strand:- start:1711 stop:2895 length:1185 start_codon:yes stop_codon:yes gene_type:complete
MKIKIIMSVLVASMFQSNIASSAEYIIGADFSPTFSYDDNVQLQEDKEGSFVTKLAPTLLLSRSVENSTVALNTGYRVERYTSLSELDRQDPFANLTGSYNTERSAYALTASYAERAQRSIADEDTGDFASNATVTSKSLAPSYQYQFNERDFAYTSFNYNERTYDTSGFSDNETRSLTTGWRRNLSERLTGGLALTYAQYESQSEFIESEYDSYNLSVTSTYLMSERWSFSGQVGYRTSDSETQSLFGGPRQTDRSSGSLFDFSANYIGELNTLTFSLSRSLNPSGEGVVNETDRVSLNWNRDIAETLSLSVNTSYQETQSADDLSNTDREYFTLSPALNWQLERNLALKMGYQYRQQKGSSFGGFDTIDDKVDSNMFFLTVNYNWDGLRFSR